jgi:hypothetical protein
VLFYAATAFAMITRQADTIFVILAFVFVALRYAHAAEHVTRNVVPRRFFLFAAGVGALAMMWIWLALKLLTDLTGERRAGRARANRRAGDRSRHPPRALSMRRCVASQIGPAARSRARPASVRTRRRIRRSAGSSRAASRPRCSSGLRLAVRVVRSIASNAATAPSVGGSGRLSAASNENWPLVKPTGRKASSNARPWPGPPVAHAGKGSGREPAACPRNRNRPPRLDPDQLS